MNFTINQTNGIRETVNSEFINKLYNLFITNRNSHTISLSGYLYSPAGYKAQMDALNQQYGPDLVIEIPAAGQYMLFHDSAVNDVLKNTIGDGTGVPIEEFQSITNDSQLGLGPRATAHPEITDFREGCLLAGLTQFNNGIPALTGLTFFGFPPNVTNFSNVFASELHFDGIVVKNWNNFINRQENSNWWENGYYIYDMDNNGNVTRIDELTLPDSVVTFPNDVLWKYSLCCAKLEELIIPATCIRLGCVAGPGIKKISFAPNSTLTTIVNGFYLNDNVSSSPVVLDVANLPQTITTIGNNAFRKCSNVTGILDLPNLTSIGQYAFNGSGITNITDLGSITSVSGMCFNNCDSLTTATLPNSCTSIDGGAFAYCDALTSIDLGGTTSVGMQAFIGDTSLTTVTGLSNLTSIGVNAFQNCPITGSVSLPNLISLGSYAFNNTRITSITDLGSITSIPEQCFQNCTSLTSVVLPSTCKTLGKYAFAGDAALTTINLSDVNRFGLQCFRNSRISGTLDLTNATIMEPHPFYKSQITKIIIPASTANNMTFIDTSNWQNLQSSGPDNAFVGMDSLTTIETDVKNWTVPFIARGCPNLQPFVIYQPLLTQTPRGVIGGGYYVDQHWANKSQWTQAYYPALTDCRHTDYFVNNYRDNVGIMTLGQGRLILDLLYLKNVLDMDNAIFINLQANIVLNSTTVPNVWSHGQGSTTRTASTYFRGEYDSASTLIDIYVPDSAVNDYKTAWPNHTDHIFGISSLNQGVIYATEADWKAANKHVGLIAEYLGLSSADLATFMTDNNLTYWTNPNA